MINYVITIQFCIIFHSLLSYNTRPHIPNQCTKLSVILWGLVQIEVYSMVLLYVTDCTSHTLKVNHSGSSIFILFNISWI